MIYKKTSSAKNTEKVKLILSSLGSKILFTVGSTCFLSILVLAIVFQEAWYIQFVAVLLSLFFIFGYIVFSFLHNITIDKRDKSVSFRNIIKKKTIKYAEIKDIKVEEVWVYRKKSCHIVFELTNGKSIRLMGYTSIFGKGVKQSREIVDRIKYYENPLP
jgi:hypothetical protein